MDKEIFGKVDWINEMKQAKKMTPEVIEAFHYLGDVIEDLMEMLCDHEDRIGKLEMLLRIHKHIVDGTAVVEI